MGDLRAWQQIQTGKDAFKWSVSDSVKKVMFLAAVGGFSIWMQPAGRWLSVLLFGLLALVFVLDCIHFCFGALGNLGIVAFKVLKGAHSGDDIWWTLAYSVSLIERLLYLYLLKLWSSSLWSE